MKKKDQRMSKRKLEKLQKLRQMALDSLAKSHRQSNHLSILIVDDNESFGRYLMIMLRSRFPGLSFDLHFSPKQALGSVVENQPDLAIVDVNMPELNGFQLAKGINSIVEKQIPILFVSANSLSADELDDLAFDCEVDFMAKPISEDVLSFKVDNLLKLAS